MWIFYTILLQIHSGNCLPKIGIQDLSLIKLLQNEQGCNFFASQCRWNVTKVPPDGASVISYAAHVTSEEVRLGTTTSHPVISTEWIERSVLCLHASLSALWAAVDVFQSTGSA